MKEMLRKWVFLLKEGDKQVEVRPVPVAFEQGRAVALGTVRGFHHLTKTSR